MSEIICGFGYFRPISGLARDKLIAKSEVERLCTDLQNGTQSLERIITQN